MGKKKVEKELFERLVAPLFDTAPSNPAGASAAIAKMQAQRNAPKAEMPYPFQAQESSKMRTCLTDCAKVIADALVEAAKIIAAGKKKRKRK